MEVDARDKLTNSRRTVTDARIVIRQHVVSKVGDLRSVLPRSNRGFSKRGRPVRDLRSGISRGVPKQPARNGTYPHTRPKLVYADDLSTTRYTGPKDTNVTIGRGGKVTISRQRGRSIDRESETVQPTGIPAHMRRQPSPPRSRSPSPPPIWQRKQHRPLTSADSPPRRRMSYSPPLAPTRPQSYIAAPRETRNRRPMAVNPRDYDVWGEPEVSSQAVYDYRHRSRSPVEPRGRHVNNPPYPGNMRGYRSRSREKFERRSPSFEPEQDRRPPSPRQWKMSPSPGYRNDGYSRNEFRRMPSPERRPVLREQRQRQAYPTAMGTSPLYLAQQSKMRMDRQTSKVGKVAYAAYPQELPSQIVDRSSRPAGGVGQSAKSLPSQMHYTIKVTSLSHEVSEDDVVELFSDIGPLISAKLIAKGHAEVSFVHKKHAQMAIDKYDRRELDGIPMKLKLIEKSAPGRIIK